MEIFSRDLRRITDQFPELAERAKKFEQELIVDGEIIASQEGRRLTFFDLQKRLGRKSDVADFFEAAAADVPVAFIIFDLLWLNGRSLLKTPLRHRREWLGGLRLPQHFQSAEVLPAHSAAEIEQIFQQARRRLNEGLMIKDPESFYSPGRRGMFWFKLKKELATLDVVVVAAELGHGKRNNVLSDYTFAVRDEATGELLPIGKAYSGLTDAEIAELTEHFRQNTIADHGRYREVKPDIVLEVAFNSIQPSYAPCEWTRAALPKNQSDPAQTKMWRQSTRSNTRGSSRPSDRTLSDGVISPIGRDCFATRLRGYCAVPSDASGVGVGEALSAVSDNGEKDGDAELADVTEEVAAVSEVAGTDATGIGVGRRLPGSGRPGSVPPGARSGSVTPGGRRGVRMVPPVTKLSPDFQISR